MTDELLPALPEPVEDVYGVMPSGSLDYHKAARDYFTADQLRAYAREAIRLAQGEPVAWAIYNAGGRQLEIYEYEEEAKQSLADYFAYVTIKPLYLSPSPPAGEVA